MKTSVRVQSEATSICGAHSENETKTEPGHRHRRMRRGRERENAEKNKRQRNANCNTRVHTHTHGKRIESIHTRNASGEDKCRESEAFLLCCYLLLMLVLLLLFCKTFVLRRRRRRYGRRRHEISMQAQEAELEHDPHDGSLTNDQSFGCKLLRRLSPQPSSKSISSRVRKVLFEKERKPERARAGE